MEVLLREVVLVLHLQKLDNPVPDMEQVSKDVGMVANNVREPMPTRH